MILSLQKFILIWFWYFLVGVLVVLNAHPGGIIYKDIIPDYVDFARTIYEGLPFDLLVSFLFCYQVVMRSLDILGEHRHVFWCWPDDFGQVVVDVNYLNVGDLVPNFQIFICWRSLKGIYKKALDFLFFLFLYLQINVFWTLISFPFSCQVSGNLFTNGSTPNQKPKLRAFLCFYRWLLGSVSFVVIFWINGWICEIFNCIFWLMVFYQN